MQNLHPMLDGDTVAGLKLWRRKWRKVIASCDLSFRIVWSIPQYGFARRRNWEVGWMIKSELEYLDCWVEWREALMSCLKGR